ncbi:hypothetical protein BDZ94DRAFT_1270039 [Collybia nuda]|uniref:Uncharacterized protein n=1 Tax=Collybia nuda TaxID=64659 RepID=A0A9P5XXP9_9AGAR|nr:hypothetical protein BDZ94DRAFT_1270039 [Collybia nuda]
MEDFRTIATCKTPLLVDARHTNISQRMRSSTAAEALDQKGHDYEFCRLLQSNYRLSSSPIFPYTPGTLTGLWEGCFMVRVVFSAPFFLTVSILDLLSG